MNSKHQKMSIRQKVLLGILSISVIAICIVTIFAMQTIYTKMREQIVQTRSMSIGWLKERLDLSIREYTEQFYSFEVDKTFKQDLQEWSSSGELGYEPKWRFITSLNAAISVNSNFNSIEIYNLVNGQVLAARRSGAVMEETGNKLDVWNARDKSLQTNVVFIREGKEILVFHQINRFEDNKGLALLVIHMRPYEFEEILADLKASKEESIVVFNDAGDLILADYGEGAPGAGVPPAEDKFRSMGNELAVTADRETVVDGNFWFYRTAGNDKLQIVQAEPNNVIMTAMYRTLNASFQVFDVVYALTGGGPGRATQTVAINIYEEAFRGNFRYGYATAKSTVLFVIVMLFTAVQLRLMKRKEQEL